MLNSNGVTKTNGKNGYSGKPVTEIITNGFFTVDRKWTVKYWNKAAERLLKVQAKDIVGKNLWQEFAGTIPLDFYTVYHKAFLQDIPVHFEEYWGETGAWFDVITYYCDDTLSVSFKSSNHPAHPDYSTQPGHPAQQLKVLNELYRFVTEVTNDCLWEWDLQAKEIFWIDGGHKRVFGYQIENALIPQNFWESRLHPDDKVRILSKINKIITEGSESVWEDEYRFQRANGDYAFVHDRGHIIFNGDKRAYRMIGATQDITTRKLAEIHLVESERKLSLIARQTVNAFIIADAEGKITWVNESFTRLTEYKREEVLGRELGSFLQGKETDPSTLEYLRKMIKDKKLFDCEILNYSKAGRKYWMRVHGQPLLDENGNNERYFVIETDITEKVLLEKKLLDEKLKAQREMTNAVLTAQENERAEIGKELHDNVNQTLAVIKLYIQMAQKDKKKREINLEKSCDLIVNVIEEIRRIAKNLVIPGTHIISLFDNINNLINDLANIHTLKIEFHADVDEEKLNDNLQINIFRIVQEQLNNILNHANAKDAAINLSRQENEIILLISDNGQGCDILKEKKGVGIINIKSRAELCHGKAEIESEPGNGFQLKVVLPLNGMI
ncbi:MAG: PAS domain S-box protein [Chitinophagaceae bacterium]